MNLRRAFTLIELLVVIATIAILAAILFPVFAQAKEAAKKATSISQMKQLATAAIMYTSDYDDVMPFGLTPNSATGTWRRTGGHAIPAGWIVSTRYVPAGREAGSGSGRREGRAQSERPVQPNIGPELRRAMGPAVGKQDPPQGGEHA